MLSADIVSSPRPAPPAKARRSTPPRSHLRDASSHYPSPPPYAPLDGADYLSPRVDHSQNDIDVLLQRADNIFREREQDLTYTTETVRTLSDAGAALQRRNSALIAYLPPSRPGSPIPPPLSPTFSPSHSRNNSHSLNLLWSPQPVTARLRKHSRRVSSTPAELAALADQNAALLERLRDLEADAARSESTGQRRLRDLEREIGGLRSELEQTRVVSERLEDALHAAPQSDVMGSTGPPPNLDGELVKMWKRLDREAKVRELKAKTRPWDNSDSVDEPRDFAPGSSHFAPKPAQTSTPVKLSGLNLLTGLNLPTSPSDLLSPTQTPRERNLVAQLLLKITELEETNAQFAAQHAEARLRLHHAELETENVRKLCDFISEEMLNIAGFEETELEELEAPGPLDSSGAPAKAGNRLRRVRRKASLQLEALREQQQQQQQRPGLGLRKFSSIESFSSVRLPDGAGAASSAQGGGAVAARVRGQRKPVLQLFEDAGFAQSVPFPTSSSDGLSPLSETSYGDLEVELRFRDGNVDGSSDTSGDGDGSARMKSLSSELGLSFGGSGGGAASPNIGTGLLRQSASGHLRSISIMELLHAAEGLPGEDDRDDVKSESLRVPGSAGPASPTSPILSPTLVDARIRYPTLRKKASLAVDTHSHNQAEKRNDLSPISSPTILISPSTSAWNTSSAMSGPIGGEDSGRTISTSPSSGGRATVEGKPASKRNPYTSLLVELWLWLQFGIILIVFVITMARMGPKSVFRPPASSAAGAQKGGR